MADLTITRIDREVAERTMAALVALGLNADTCGASFGGIVNVVATLRSLGIEFSEWSTDDEDCPACADIETVCRFHLGSNYGWVEARRVVSALLYEPECIDWKGVAIAEHDEHVGVTANAICLLGVDHDHTDGSCYDALRLAREKVLEAGYRDPRPERPTQ